MQCTDSRFRIWQPAASRRNHYLTVTFILKLIHDWAQYLMEPVANFAAKSAAKSDLPSTEAPQWPPGPVGHNRAEDYTRQRSVLGLLTYLDKVPPVKPSQARGTLQAQSRREGLSDDFKTLCIV
jgi:hypothetical protein